MGPLSLSLCTSHPHPSAVYCVRHSAHPGWETQEVPSLSRGIRVRCSQPLLGHCVPVPPAAAAHRSGPLTPRPASKLWHRCGWYPQIIYQPSKSVYELSCANLNLHGYVEMCIYTLIPQICVLYIDINTVAVSVMMM